jgi:hypothetical protein
LWCRRTLPNIYGTVVPLPKIISHISLNRIQPD